MMLDHITTTACPECGCTEICLLELRDRHSNGHWNERLTFACGLDLRYSASYLKVTQEEDCKRSDRAVTWNSQRKIIAQAMVDAAKREAGKPDANLGLLLTRLRIDLNNYRDELEQFEEQEAPHGE